MFHLLHASLFVASVATVSQAATPSVAIPTVARPPVLEDYRDGTPPQGELVIDQFLQRDPNDGEPASEQTTAYLSRDRRALYVAFRCRDRQPDAVRARLSQRDQIQQDDQVVVALDTFHDRQRAYLFVVNPLGVQADASLSEGRDDDYSFDALWESVGRRTPEGFVVLMTIPFKSLRTDPHAATWGLALSRVLPRRSEQAFWPFITRRVEGTTQQFADMTWTDPPAGNSRLQLIPYGAATAARFLDLDRAVTAQTQEARAGLDAKVILRDAVTLDIALNPDFSQVESDQPQVSINQRFELFYPEKRPFFLENASLFRLSAVPPTRNLTDMLFFSRRIQDPSLGIRLTGKLGPWAIGGLVARDRGPGIGATASSAHATAVVGRVVRELGHQSTVGLFTTSRHTTLDGNDVLALDGRWKIGQNLVAVGQSMWSRTTATQQPVDARGTATNAALLYTGRNVFATLFYSDRSPAFRNALGFVPRIDFRQIEHYGEYRWRPRRGPIVAIGPNSYLRLNWSFAGGLQEWIVRFPFQVDLKGRTSVFVRRVEQRERVAGVDLREHFQSINVTTEWLKWLAINENFEWGATPNYLPVPGRDPYVARSTSASLALTIRPAPRLRIEPSYLLSSLTQTGQPGLAPGAVFTNHIARGRVQYQFTRVVSGRTIVDYSAVLPNEQRVRLARDKRLGVDGLLTIQTGPSTAFFVGYTEGFRNLRVTGDGRAVELIGRPTESVGRQLFVKLSYLWRL